MKKRRSKDVNDITTQWRDRKLETKRMRAGEIMAHPLNPKIHPDKQNEPLRALLDEVGQLDALKAYYSQRNNGALTFFDGHARQGLDPDQEWNIDIYDLTDEEADIALATFDPIGYQAQQDSAAVNRLLAQVRTQNESLQSFLRDQARQHAEALTHNPPPGGGGDDFQTVVFEAQTRVKSGDLWQLGKHRLLIGDSTNAEDVIKLMDGERAILFATDPPYLVEFDGTNHPTPKAKQTATKKHNGKDWSDKYQDLDAGHDGGGLYDGFIAAAISHAIAPKAAWYCWHANLRQYELQTVWHNHGALVHQVINWVKSRKILTRSWYLSQHEPCLFGWIKGQQPARCSDEQHSTIWDIPNSEIETDEHPTSKPIEIFARPMRLHTKPGDLCYEPFGGSGSQIIAAERNARRCFAIEREPKFGELIVRRWEAETSQKAVLLDRPRTRKK